jgi:hypothetical protein
VLPAYTNNDAFRDHSMSQQQKVNRSLFYAILVGISFWLMLVFMTYNGFLMISVVIGAGLGHYAFGSNLPSDRGVQCHWPVRILASQILLFSNWHSQYSDNPAKHAVPIVLFFDCLHYSIPPAHSIVAFYLLNEGIVHVLQSFAACAPVVFYLFLSKKKK